ncbi:unnamed protein product [Vitrella brassicaformis CCMP3155]|uniref:SET domain-containing protein n=2 Tax=Vitrella brassicaformis TaxID=1169539 RepID=A0A0G4EWR5_VITBC|nr:unnamed protein product [Vitrella brassicaformis CCMP3155]|mmetsp:Transcript_54081/g.136049  ORF Transcript_54081/g.136049 Transcript_54081/m.136049 type:complete len:702 (+) Transcript_54081:347-2452(+)|eukprot:CEM02509.1 unnamed protein product [Vitrella brassicaformis CCMP3155]
MASAEVSPLTAPDSFVKTMPSIDPSLPMNDLMVASVDPINGYILEKFGGTAKVVCQMSDTKGRIIVSNCHISKGEVIFVETPLHAVQEDRNNEAYKLVQKLQRKGEWDFEPLWYWCALKSALLTNTAEQQQQSSPKSKTAKAQPSGAKGGKVGSGGGGAAAAATVPKAGKGATGGVNGVPWSTTLLKSHITRILPKMQERLLMLFAPDKVAPSRAVKKLVTAFDLAGEVNEAKLEKLLQVWIHNCFEHEDDPVGYAVFFLPSFLSHACDPNAVWHYDEASRFVLRARQDIRPGDEVCVSYVSEEGLFEPSHLRRFMLHKTKGFICLCPRCTAPYDKSRGFVCPRCRKGTVFLTPNDSLIKDLQQASAFIDHHQKPQGKDGKDDKSAAPPPPAAAASAAASSSDPPAPTPQSHTTSPSAIRAYVCTSCGAHIDNLAKHAMLKQERHWVSQLRRMSGEEDEFQDDHRDQEILWRQKHGKAAPLPPHITVPLLNQENMKEHLEAAEREEQKDLDEGEPEGDDKYAGLVTLPMDLQGRMDKEVKAIFTQHWAAMKWHGLLHDFSVMKRHKDYVAAVDHMRARLDLQYKMFDGDAGSVGWALEELSTTLLRKGGYGGTGKPSRNTRYARPSGNEREESLQVLTEAYAIMSRLFGQEHEYTERITQRRDMVQAAVRKSALSASLSLGAGKGGSSAAEATNQKKRPAE